VSNSSGRRVVQAFVLSTLGIGMQGTLRAQEFLWEVDGDPSSTGFGVCFASVGDVDDDGADDFAVTDPLWSDATHRKDGAFYVYSGRSQALLWSVTGDGDLTQLGDSIAELGDVDGDGYPELAIGSEKDYFSPYLSPQIYVYSPRKQALLYAVPLPYDSGYAASIADLGDVDLDGVSDFVVAKGGSVFVVSGATGVILSQWKVLWMGDRPSVDRIGDLDGDGIPELVVGAPLKSTGPWTSNGQASVQSAVDGHVLFTIDGVGNFALFGEVVRGGLDLDQDGTPDLVVGDQISHAIAYSGATQAEITRWEGAFNPDRGLAVAGDLDHDGVQDLLMYSATDSAIRAISGRTWAGLFELPGVFHPCGRIDVDGNGNLDVLTFSDANLPVGAVQAYSGTGAPTVAAVTPARAGYRVRTDVTITGSGFASGTGLTVSVGTQALQNLAVVDFATITGTIDPDVPGPCDLVVSNSLGSGTAAGAFVWTPAVLLDGDATPGGHITLRHLLDPHDGVFSVIGLPPAVSIPTPPFDGQLCISPFFLLLYVKAGNQPLQEIDLAGDLPNDPALIGTDLLFQALIGPKFSSPGKDATWTNCAVLSIH